MISRMVRPSGDIVDRWLMVSHTDDDGAMERSIGLAMTASIEAVTPGRHT